MSTFKLVALTFALAVSLLAVVYIPTYLFLGGPAVPVWFLVAPALMVGLTTTLALDKPLQQR
ncbi:hypothetical protein [Mycobacterium sp. NPDC050853]|uniref:hypothetical protein n=1 Tax=Mycobacterium sp. NPDC050853 TaxID=3155160 RepID=UPI0033CBD1CF